MVTFYHFDSEIVHFIDAEPVYFQEAVCQNHGAGCFLNPSDDSLDLDEGAARQDLSAIGPVVGRAGNQGEPMRVGQAGPSF